MHKISIVIITYNEESRIRPTLESVKWCDEIIVIDSCSTDKTIDICKEYSNCKVYMQPFLGYGLQKRFAVEKASHHWIFSIDADEVMTDFLRNEISSIASLPTIEPNGFYVPITTIFMKRVFKYGHDNKHLDIRFFNKNKGTFNTNNLHEGIEVEGAVSKLKNEILHYSYINTRHYFEKFNKYSELYKDQALKKGKKINALQIAFRLPLEFMNQYLIRLNFLNGFPGFVWAVFSTFYVFVKSVKVYEANLNN